MEINQPESIHNQQNLGVLSLGGNYFLNQDILLNYLNKIDKVFNTEKVLKSDIDKNRVQNYYHDSNFGYNLVHSKEGSVHMALNYDGVFNEDGYYQQAIEIEENISKKGEDMILELGCGKGFNSFYLANKQKSSTFYGIDITNKHLAYAKEKAKDIDNLNFSYGDFHSINFEDSTFDIVFELESVCHSNDPRTLLKEAYRVLKTGGKFILYEGFRTSDYDQCSDMQKKMAELIEKSMAVNEGYKIDEWLNIAKEVGFKIKANDDISGAIMPNLIRFHRLARKYFRYTFLSKIILAVMPSNLIKNTIAGVLMPFSISQEVQSYNKIILVK